ncbi:hypothetical protein Elgi_44830 [Paenibacillus elgii]|uniref:YphA family membrane protein n=1 Tax=Paenibacillus elgii TaxID=189691 RepID=UPI002D7BA8C3|nr:hypothetical protein Elgi_44830 [Paenibacillus elgii]
MNAGYVSLLLIVVALILFASGWKNVILRGITPTSLLLFFMLWILFMRWSTDWGGIRVFGCTLLLLTGSLWVMVRTPSFLYRFHLLSIALLLGSVYFFMRETLHLMPAVIWFSSEWTVAASVGFLAAALLRWPPLQIAGLSLGLLIGDIMLACAHREQMAMTLGQAEFQDEWWLTAFAARGCSLLLEGTVAGTKLAFNRMRQMVRSGREPEND